MVRGANLQFFIEGQPSRTGRSSPPKAALLDMVNAACVLGPVKDALFVPVAYAYDRPVDLRGGSEAALRLRGGQVAPSCTLWDAVRAAWTLLRRDFGGVRVSFAHPVLLSQFRASLASCPSNAEPVAAVAASPPPAATIGAQLAAHCLHFSQRALPLTASHLCAFLLLTRHREGATLPALTASFERLWRQLRSDCRFAFSAASRPQHAVESAVLLLAPHLELQRDNAGRVQRVAPLLAPPRAATELAYFASHVVEALAMDCVKAAAVVAAGGLGPGGLVSARCLHRHRPLRLQRPAWRHSVTVLVRLLAFDFTFRPPCVPLEVAIDRDTSLWRSFSGGHGGGGALASRLRAQPREPAGPEEMFAWMEVELPNPDVAETLACLCLGLGPLLEAFWATCRVVYDLPCDAGVTHEPQIARRTLKMLQRRHDKGALIYGRSSSLSLLCLIVRYTVYIHVLAYKPTAHIMPTT